jgi:AcrR family transcriptional regulator
MATSVALPRSVRPFVPPPPPKTPKSAGTRQRLMDLAGQMFVERGYDAVSIRDIATAANLTKGAVYGHFRSKGQLLVEVIRWRIAESDQATDYVAARTSVERGAELIHDESNRDTRLLEVDAAAAARHDPEVAAGLRSLYLDRHAQICDAMSEVGDPDTAAWVVTALTAGVGMKESAGLPLPDADRLTAAISAALNGLISQREGRELVD